jgi:hypothetical protein
VVLASIGYRRHSQFTTSYRLNGRGMQEESLVDWTRAPRSRFRGCFELVVVDALVEVSSFKGDDLQE